MTRSSGGGEEAFTWGEHLQFDVVEGFPGELRMQLYSPPTPGGQAPGVKAIANAGIFLTNVMAYMSRHQCGLYKAFTLYSVADNVAQAQACGVVELKLTYAPTGGKRFPVPTMMKPAMSSSAAGSAGVDSPQ